MIEARRGKLKRAAVEYRADLVTGASDRCRGSDDLGPRTTTGTERIDGDLVNARHGSERPRDKMQFVLDDEGRRRATCTDPEQASAVAIAGDLGILVGRADDQGRRFGKHVLVHRPDRKTGQ